MPKKPARTLPAFTPVPRKKARSNGWNPDVQRAFIEALAETGSVEAACRRVNRAAVGAYLLRRHPQGGSFRKAWEAALDLGIQKIEDVAMDRALNGVEVPVYAYGRIIGTRRVYNDRLLMFMLRNRAPKRFAADGARGMNALDRQRVDKLKREWRREWEREQAEQAQADEAEILDSLNARLEAIRRNEEALMSEETRRLRDAFYESQRRDLESGGGMLGADQDDPEAEFQEYLASIGPSPEQRRLMDSRKPKPPDDGWQWIDPDEDSDDDEDSNDETDDESDDESDDS